MIYKEFLIYSANNIFLIVLATVNLLLNGAIESAKRQSFQKSSFFLDYDYIFKLFRTF